MAATTVMLQQVEAKYPALLFKQQLDAFVQKIFPMLRDNVKKEITPQLAACIHAPRQATARNRRTRDLGSVLSGDGPSTPGNPFEPFTTLCPRMLAITGCWVMAPAHQVPLWTLHYTLSSHAGHRWTLELTGTHWNFDPAQGSAPAQSTLSSCECCRCCICHAVAYKKRFHANPLPSRPALLALSN